MITDRREALNAILALLIEYDYKELHDYVIRYVRQAKREGKEDEGIDYIIDNIRRRKQSK